MPSPPSADLRNTCASILCLCCETLMRYPIPNSYRRPLSSHCPSCQPHHILANGPKYIAQFLTRVILCVTYLQMVQSLLRNFLTCAILCITYSQTVQSLLLFSVKTCRCPFGGSIVDYAQNPLPGNKVWTIFVMHKSCARYCATIFFCKVCDAQYSTVHPPPYNLSIGLRICDFLMQTDCATSTKRV
jgi:hypothetical protein